MNHTRIATAAVGAAILVLGPARVASAQVCMGIPADQGEIAIQGEVLSDGAVTAYGGRLGLNFNTEYSFDIGMRRPELADGTGTILWGVIGYEMSEYEPPVCFTIGVRHERRPEAGGDISSETLVPIGFGIGKRLGSAKRLSLALFVRPEYLIRIKPDPPDETASFWDELGKRSAGRGVIGLLATTPFLFASGAVEVATPDYRPSVSVGLGVIF